MKMTILCSWLMAAAARAGDGGGAAATSPAAPDSAATATQVKHVDAAAAERLVTEKKVVILDLRTPSEFAAGHIAGATNIDFRATDFGPRLAPLDRSQPYLVYCASGRRGTNSLAVFKKLGFKEIVHLDGGLNAWQKAAKPVSR